MWGLLSDRVVWSLHEGMGSCCVSPCDGTQSQFVLAFTSEKACAHSSQAIELWNPQEGTPLLAAGALLTGPAVSRKIHFGRIVSRLEAMVRKTDR